MTLLADKDERFKGLFVKIALFVLLALLGVLFNFFYAALRQGVFLQKTPVYFVAPSSQDIREGMAVKLSGFKIGTVKSMSLNEQAQTRVEVLIDDRYLHFLREDAELTPQREGVIGDSILAVDRGTESKPQLQAGAEIKYVQTGGLEQITQDLRDRLFPAIDDVSQLLHDFNDPHGDFRSTLRNLRELTEELKGTRARLDGVLGDAQPLVRSLNKSSASLEQNLPGLLNKADATLDNLQKGSAALRSALETAGPQISGLAGEGRELVHDARKTVDSLNNNWLLKSGVPQEKPGLVNMDSHD